jgi:WD40 repeat protein
MNPSGEQFYSGGLDSIISVWNIPHADVDAYDPYGTSTMSIRFVSFCYSLSIDSNVLCKVLEGHTDAVWQLVIAGQKLLSTSADGSVRLWDPNLTSPLQSIYQSKTFIFFIDRIDNRSRKQFR